jgi:hypothetical protein
VERLLPFNGAYLQNGLVQLSLASHGGAVRFLNGARDSAAIAGMTSLVHETLHGHAPIGVGQSVSADSTARQIDHLLVATAAEAIMAREFKVSPMFIVTSVPYGIKETVDLIARHTGHAAARDALYDAALRYFGPGAVLLRADQVEQRVVDAVNAATGKRLDEPLRRHLRALPAHVSY